MRKSKEPPLAKQVENALEKYFSDLNGERPAGLYDLVMREVEAPLLRVVMEQASRNQTRAADMLGINRNTLRKKLRSHGLD